MANLGGDELVEFLAPAEQGAFIRPRGEDLKLGELVISAGKTLTPDDLGLLASVNRAMVEVVRRPRVAIVATGVLQRLDHAGGHGEDGNQHGDDAGSTSEAVQSNTIGRLREQHATVARQEATLSAELGPRHPYVVEARAPDGFSNIDAVLGYEDRKAIVRGYASTAGFAREQVNKAKAA